MGEVRPRSHRDLEVSWARITFPPPGQGSSCHTPAPHSELYFCWKAQMKILFLIPPFCFC